MAEVFYEALPATDGVMMNPVPGAVFEVFEIADTTYTTPLSLRVGAGNPSTTVTASDPQGIVPGVYVTSDNFEHNWKSGDFVWRRDSIDGAKAEIQRAESSALAAANLAADAVTQSTAAKQAAQDAAALVDAPADEVLANIAGNPASQFATQLSATIAEQVDPVVEGIAAEYLASNPAVADAAALAAGPAVEAALASGQINAVACFGDSMFADSGSLGVTVPGYLTQELGVEVFAGGVGGQTSTEIAVRQGGLDVFLTVANNTIPASGTVAVTVNSPAGDWRPTGGFTCLGTLAGVAGTLSRTAEGAWSFIRSETGTAVTVAPETRWESAYNVYGNRVSLFRSGRNNLASDPALILRDDKAMVSGLAGTNNRYLVLSVYNTGAEKAGGTGHGRMTTINNNRRDTFGQNYYDLRGWIIRHGLAQAGITPTAQDLQDIADDVIPTSLRVDDTHMNAAGRQVEAKQLARILRAKGWIERVPTILTVTNLADNPRAGVDTTAWSVSTSGGAGTGARVATGGPLPEAPTFYRANWTAIPTVQQVLLNGSGKNLIVAEKTYTAKAYARASWAGATAQIVAGRTDGSIIVGTSPSGGIVSLSPNVWTALPSVTFTAEATAIRARLTVQLAGTSVMPSASDYLDVSAWFLHDVDDRLVGVLYRDGDMEDWAWSGVAHNSPSTGTITI